MTSPDQIGSAPVAPAEVSHTRRNVVLASVASLALTGAALTATSNGPFGGEANAQAGDQDIEQLCGDYTDANVTSDAGYHEHAILEKFDISTKQEAKGVIDNAFSANGPLAGKGDFISSAAVQALVVDRAMDESKAVDPNYDYIAKFDEAIAKYSAKGGQAEARKDCITNKDVLSKTGEYTTDWANGEPVVAVKFVRDGDYGVTGMTLENYVAKDKMEGVEFAYREGAKKVNNSFASALYEEGTGMIYLKGVRIQSGKTATKTEGLAGAKQNQEGTAEAPNNGGGTDNSEGGPTGGTNGTTGNRGTTVGSVPEKNDGPAGGNTAGSGNTPEAAPNGNDNTPGAGPGTGPTGPGAGPGPGPGTGGGGTGGGEAPAPQPPREEAPAPQPPREEPPAPRPEPTREPQPEPTRPAPEPTREPQPTQPPTTPPPTKGEETPPGGGACDPEFNPENC